MAKLKRELSSQKKYKAIAWEQLSSFEVMHAQVVHKWESLMQQCWRRAI